MNSIKALLWVVSVISVPFAAVVPFAQQDTPLCDGVKSSNCVGSFFPLTSSATCYGTPSGCCRGYYQTGSCNGQPGYFACIGDGESHAIPGVPCISPCTTSSSNCNSFKKK